MSRSSADLMAEVFPGVEVRKELGEHETLLGIDKARRLLGYEPAALLARPRRLSRRGAARVRPASRSRVRAEELLAGRDADVGLVAEDAVDPGLAGTPPDLVDGPAVVRRGSCRRGSRPAGRCSRARNV